MTRCFLLAMLVSQALSTARIDWKTNYEAALLEATRTGKLVVAHFWLAGRPLHETMEKETFSNAEVIRLSNERFLNVKIDIGSRPELFERTIGGRGGFGTCVLDGTGDVVSVLPGFADPPAYLEFLRRGASGYAKLKVVRAAAARNPNNPAFLHKLAERYWEMGSPRRAQENYGRLIQLEAQARGEVLKFVAIAYERIGRLHALKGRNREARWQVAEYRRLDPNNRYRRLDRVLLTEALVSWIERRFRDSIRILEEALEKFGQSEERDQMLLALGTVRHEGGEDQKALEILAKLIKEHPDSGSIAQAKEQIAHIKNPPADHQH